MLALRRYVCLVVLGAVLLPACASAPALDPPAFDYGQLSERYYRDNPGGYFPLTIQRGTNLQSSVALSGHMVYTSNVLGSGDVWLRDLDSTVSVPLVKHPAEQYKPAITAEGDRLVFVSEDVDTRGDLRIVTIDPEEIMLDTLNGLPPEDVWEESRNLSPAIQELAAASLPPQCHGQAAETDPVWNHNGTALAFVTDRCSPNLYNVWIMEMDADVPVALRQITRSGGIQPGFGSDSKEIVYVVNRAGESAIYLTRLDDMETFELELPTGTTGQRYLYSDPALTRRRDPRGNVLPGRTLYYASVRRDSNRNGRLDDGDAAAVFARDLDVQGAHERKILGDDTTILSTTHSDHGGGMLLYGARLYNSVNVYFMRPRGVIPLEPDIDRQYHLTENYRTESPNRYLLALDAVEQYFGESGEFLIYEGRILLDRLEFHRLRNEDRLAEETRAKIEERGRANPYTALLYQLYKLKQEGRDQAPQITAFIENTRQGEGGFNDAQRKIVTAAAYDRLAEYYHSRERFVEALVAVTFLNENFPNYYRRFETLREQARLELIENYQRLREARNVDELQQLPFLPHTYEILMQALRNTPCPTEPAHEAERCHKDRARLQEEVHSDLFDFFYTQRSPAEALELAFFALQKSPNSDVFVRATLRTVKARALFEDRQYQPALNECQSLLAEVPRIPPPLDGAGGPQDGWRSVYVRAWRISSYVYERRGEYSQAYEAKLAYGGAYSKEAGVTINTEDFVEIINESEGYINLYLRTARSISAAVKANESLILGETIGTAITQISNTPIDIGGAEMDVLYEFCQPSSRTGSLFTPLGPGYKERYIEFCINNEQLIQNRNYRKFPIRSARAAADLLYTASYANAAVLNIMFFNIKKLDVLGDLYEERAVHYQRLKIDIAAEQNQRQLEAREREIVLLEGADVQDLFAQSDPYASESFDRLIFGYRTSLEPAARIGDLSSIYGYAYILIRKNVERERYYDRIQNRAAAQSGTLSGLAQLQPGGVELPRSLLIEKKEEILRDMKNAEYLLQYILNVDPLNVDAYLLLGWLHQYIDERRSKEVKTVPSLLENIYLTLTRTQQTTQTDGRFYADLYQVFFPENLYESNVELYRQALQKVEADAGAPRAVASLNLNLANNYFQLLNFQRAVEHYRKAEEAMGSSGGQNAAAGEAFFDDYVRRALFEFNLGRALFYDGKLADAVLRLERAYEIYDEYERKPLHEKFSTLNFLLRSARDLDSTERRLQREEIKRIVRRSEEVRAKMALIAALIGLAYWEDGKHDEAVLFYQDAILRLYDNGVGESEEGGIDRASLMNFLALAYQGRRDFYESDVRAREAARYARDDGLVRYDDRFQPQSLGGKALGCILPYGEDFSIIGDGRNPYGFSPLRQYHLSLGIQLENRILRGDLEGAAYLLRQRRQAFLAKDMDVRLGRLGYTATLNQEALNLYRAEEFRRSADVFREAADVSREYDFLQSLRRNYYNYFKALFADFEAGERVENPDSFDAEEERELREDRRNRSLAEIEEALSELEDFREEYRDELKEQFIQQRRSEVPDYEYDEERDGPALDERLNLQRLDILTIGGSLHYYRGRLRMQDDAAANRRAALQDFERARELYDEALSVLPKIRDPQRPLRTIRIQLNRARAFRDAGKLHHARDALIEVVEDAYEFNLIREEWLGRTLLAETYAELHAAHGRAADRNLAAGEFDNAVTLLYENRHMYSSMRRHADPFFTAAADFYVQVGDENRALRMLEWRWEFYLNDQFYRNPLQFEDAEFEQDYRTVRTARLRLGQLDRSESRLRIERRAFEKIVARKTELRQEHDEALARLERRRPLLRPFLRITGKEEPLRPDLGVGGVLMRFFVRPSRPEEMDAWCFTNRGNRFLKATDALPANAARDLVSRCAAAAGPVADLFIISGPELYHLDFNEIVASIDKELPRPTFAARLSDRFAGFLTRSREAPDDLRFFNVQSGVVFNSDRVRNQNADIVGLRMPAERTLFPATEDLLFDPAAWISRGRYTSIAVVSTGRGRGPEAYRRKAGLYEILRASGAGTVAFVYGEAGDEELEHLADIALAPDTELSEDELEDAAEAREEDTTRAAVHGIMKARGRERYTGVNLRVFGSSGHDRRRHTAELLERYNRARENGRVAEEEGRFDRAFEYYRLASAYIDGHPQKKELAFTNQLDRARVLLRLPDERKQGREVVRTLIERHQGDADRLARVYDTAVETLLIAGATDEARRYLEEYVGRFPERRAAILRKNALLTFRSRIGDAAYASAAAENRNFERDFNSVYRQIVIGDDPLSFAEDLLKHGRHDEARRVAEGARSRNRGERENFDALAYAVQADEHLLDPRRKSVPTGRGVNSFEEQEPAAADLLHLSFQGDWQAYNDGVQALSMSNRPDQDLAMQKFRRRLFEQWSNYRRQDYVNVQDVANVTLQAGASAYTRADLLERSMIYRILLDTADSDPELQVARLLENLIDVERKNSTSRAAHMALGAADEFLTAGDFITARRFFQTYIDLLPMSLRERERDLRAARTATALSAADLFTEIRNNQADWKERHKDKPASARRSAEESWRRALLIDFQKTLNTNNLGVVNRLYSELPITFSSDEIEAFNAVVRAASGAASAGPVSPPREVLTATAILKDRALGDEDWRMLADLAFFEQEYRNDLSARRLGRTPANVALLRPMARELFAKLPANQEFVVFVDTAESAVRITYRERALQGVVLKTSGRYLRGRLNDFLIRRRTGRAADDLREELSRIYRSLFGLGQTGTTYYWLPGVHALAPLAPERGDRLFQVLNPRAMLANERAPVLSGSEFFEGFGVRSIGAEPSGSRAAQLYGSEERALFFRRLTNMERLSLGSASDLPADPRHLLMPVFPDRPVDLSGVSKTATGAWFFSGNRLILDPATEVENFNYLLYSLGEHLQGPGVMTLRSPDAVGHAYFVRDYYSRTLPGSEIYRRFLAAIFNLRRETGMSGDYGYRLMTASFLRGDSR